MTEGKTLSGVNLGGWLLLEPWMTPSLFADSSAGDEFTFCLRATAADKQRLRQHYENFITEEDFAWLATQGINTVRLPVGYWLFGDAPPYSRTVQYVDKSFVWAAKHGVKILISLHGLPGSQNGQMHSGRTGQILWHTNIEYIERSLDILQRLAERYGQHKALLGISVINEPPKELSTQILMSYYQQAHKLLYKLCKPGMWIVISDAFKPRRWYYRMHPARYPNLYIDHHQYQLVSQINQWLPARLQVWRARLLLPVRVRRMSRYHGIIIGEWSLALRHDKLKRLSDTQRDQIMESYAQAQVKAFKHSAAWFFWSYKTEGQSAWNLRACIDKGWLQLD